ncbi:MAG: hypothetical protein AAF702_13975 [Chloroflexota bacterium]
MKTQIHHLIITSLAILVMIAVISRTAIADRWEGGRQLEAPADLQTVDLQAGDLQASVTGASVNAPDRLPTIVTAFTYQGRLTKNGGTLANGLYNFRFTLYTDASGGSVIGSTVTRSDVGVSNGLFSIELDFGSVFDGTPRWLEVEVEATDVSGFTTLSPRQPIRPAPFAIHANSSSDSGNNGGPISIDGVSSDGITICSTGGGSCDSGLFDDTRHHALEIIATTHDALYIYAAGDDGVQVRQSVQHGMLVESAGFDGISVCSTGSSSCDNQYDAANGNSGVEIHRAEGDGIQILEAGRYGIWVHSAGTKAARFDGNIVVSGAVETGTVAATAGADLAEHFAIQNDALTEPGMVVVIDPENPGQLRLAEGAYDRKVAGIISGAGGIQPGISIGQAGTLSFGDVQVALAGTVYAWADATSGSIEPGDLLTTSNRLGHAMKVDDYGLAQGAILGKAMTSLEEGTGLVLVLVTLQ